MPPLSNAIFLVRLVDGDDRVRRLQRHSFQQHQSSVEHSGATAALWQYTFQGTDRDDQKRTSLPAAETATPGRKKYRADCRRESLETAGEHRPSAPATEKPASNRRTRRNIQGHALVGFVNQRIAIDIDLFKPLIAQRCISLSSGRRRPRRSRGGAGWSPPARRAGQKAPEGSAR